MISYRKSKRYSKLYYLHKRFVNNSGIILMAILWILVILALLAIGLGRSTHVELSLTKYSLGKMKSNYLAWAGINYAIDKIYLDSKDDSSKQQDTVYYCAIPFGNAGSPGDIFLGHSVGEGYFNIEYGQKDYASQQYNIYPGIQDEDRKLNINAINISNVDALINLIILLGEDEQTAKRIAYSVVDWKDTNDLMSDNTYGAENAYYSELAKSYKCKNRPFDLRSELLLVRGMSQEFFNKLKGYVTVFPKQGVYKINFDTASELILLSLARSESGKKTDTTQTDADSLVAKLLEHRRGVDGKDFSNDDRSINIREIDLGAKEKSLFYAMNIYRKKRSDYLNINLRAVENSRGIETRVDAIVYRNDLRIVYWKRD